MGGTSAVNGIVEKLFMLSRLIQEAAATNKKDLRVGSEKATLGIGACHSWRKCMFLPKFCEIDNVFCPHRF